MKKFHYIEFTDGYWGSSVKYGHLYLVAKNVEDYMNEIPFEVIKGNAGTQYRTTLKQMGELGWELAFVTPCGYLREEGGMIQNAYVFKKEIDA